MRIVLQTASVSWAESVRLALVGAGIDAVVMDPFSTKGLGVEASVRVAIVDDADIHRAAAVIETLRPPKSAFPPSWWWHKRALIAVGVAFFLPFFGSQMADAAPRWLQLAILTVSLTLFAGSIAFIILGFRADKRARP